MVQELWSPGQLVIPFRTDTLIYSDANHFNDCPLANDRSIVPWSSTITDTILVLPEVNEADDDRAEDQCVRQLNSACQSGQSEGAVMTNDWTVWGFTFRLNHHGCHTLRCCPLLHQMTQRSYLGNDHVGINPITAGTYTSCYPRA